MSHTSPPSSRRDPSSTPNLFAQRLTDALGSRGLSLQRIQARLVATDLKVSTATLSYWASGRSRPTRNRSLDVVKTLEQILEVPPGHLVEAMAGERQWQDLTHLLPQAIELPHDLQLAAQTQAQNWRRTMIHDCTHVGPDRTERYITTTQLNRAEVEGLDTWTHLVQSEPGQDATIHPGPGLVERRSHALPEGNIFVLEAALPRPLRRGESILTSFRTEFGPDGQPQTQLGRGLTTATDLLVLEVHFECEPPRRLERRFVPPQGSQEEILDRSLFFTGAHAQCVVPNAVPGTHMLTWQW